MQNIDDKPYILLVEDSRLASVFALAALTELGCQVDVAETGEKALELAVQNQYDLIFMDLGLPNIDGITVTKELKKRKNRRQTPVVALTAHNDDTLRNKCLAAQMAGFITKPLTSAKASSFIKN